MLVGTHTVHVHDSPDRTKQRGSQDMNYIVRCDLYCFVCRLRPLLGLWGHSVVKRLPPLPSSLTHIMSKYTSPLMAMAPTKVSLSTSRPQVLQPPLNGKEYLFRYQFENDHNRSFHVLIAEKVCQAVVTPHSTLTPQKPEYSPGETGTVTCELGYVANKVSVQRTRTF